MAGRATGRGNGVTSGTVSGQGTTIAIEIFATGVGTSLIGMTLEFDFDSSLLSFVEAENSAFPLVLPEGSTGTHLATRNPVTLASSGFLARAEFTTVSDVAAREFSIGIESVTLAESTTSSDELITTSVITFNASPSPDFDGDDWVGFSDFLIFAQVFGSERGDGTYDARIDLNSDGSIGFTDFLIFAQSFGSAPPSTGGGSPDLVVQSPSVSDNNVASGAHLHAWRDRPKPGRRIVCRHDVALLPLGRRDHRRHRYGGRHGRGEGTCGRPRQRRFDQPECAFGCWDVLLRGPVWMR